MGTPSSAVALSDFSLYDMAEARISAPFTNPIPPTSGGYWSAQVAEFPGFQFVVDLGSTQTLSGLSIRGPSPETFPVVFTSQYSIDGNVWTNTNVAKRARATWMGSDVDYRHYFPEGSFEDFVLGLGPLAYWPLDEAPGATVAQDLGPNGLHGTLLSPSQISFREGPPLRNGRTSSMGFNINSAGTGQVYVNSASLRTLADPGNSFTIGMFHHRTATTTYNNLLAYYSDPYFGTANYRIINNLSAESPQNTNQAYGYMPNDQTTFVGYRKDAAQQHYSLQVNLQRSYAAGFTDPVRGGSWGLVFPAAAEWAYYPARGWLSDVVIFNRALTNTEMDVLSLGGDSVRNDYSEPPLYGIASPPSLGCGDYQAPDGAPDLLPTARHVDTWDGGTVSIVGNVKKVGLPANQPLRRKVRLYHLKERRFLRETWSDAVTGDFVFPGLKAEVEYYVMVLDHEHVYRALVADRIVGA